MKKRLGIIAGSGKFPTVLAVGAREMGYAVSVIAHTDLTFPGIEGTADKTYWIKIGQLSKMINLLKEEGITEIVMAGGISKKLLFSHIEPDQRGLALLLGLKDKKDDTILRGFAAELEKEGFIVKEATSYIKSIIAGHGRIGAREPEPAEWDDIRFALPIAREIGRLDIGQCIVVKNLAVLAVEAIEGTDETIRRGGRYANGGAVVVKICKPGQDTRFDLPTVGPGTIEVMKEVRASVLAVEADMTIMIDRSKMIEEADRAGISIVGIG